MRISDWSSDVCSSDLRSETKTDADRTARADIVAVDVDHIVPALLEFAIAGAGDVAHFERDLALRAKCGETLTDHRVEAQPRPFHDRRLLERASLKPPAVAAIARIREKQCLQIDRAWRWERVCKTV